MTPAARNNPLVGVFTPVYNGAAYLAECIESVLAQDYADFEYTILNNCSTDGTLDIANAYANKDRRIRVRTNSTFVSAIENHNLAFGLVRPEHKYCKVVSADDWILPECLSRMVALAEAHPQVGIVGCYQQSLDRVRWQGLPPSVSVMSGRELGRLTFLDGIRVFGTPTSVMYRGDLVRMRPAFFPHNGAHADTSACFEVLKSSDFGFVHDVLAVERVHGGQWTAEMDSLNANLVSWLEMLLQYGPVYLTPAELAALKQEGFDTYYRGLGGCLLKLKGQKFWTFHRERCRELGIRWEWARIARAALNEIITEAREPATAMRKVRAAILQR